MADNKLHENEAFLITEALKYYGKYMRRRIHRIEKTGVRSVYHENFFAMMGEHITNKLPRVTYKRRPPRKY